jgi:hypothetical protein
VCTISCKQYTTVLCVLKFRAGRFSAPHEFCSEGSVCVCVCVCVLESKNLETLNGSNHNEQQIEFAAQIHLDGHAIYNI